ncbi:MAG: ribose-phosphate pyrophosphokinase [Cytophagales bacterium]|nr:MAG: ribose-phosphate pyrophosphokinase [Cytophagales bacterium]
MNDKSILFSTQSYAYLKQEILLKDGFEEGQIECKTFPDGEHYYRILTNVEYREVTLIGGTITDKDTLELYDVACGLVEGGARKLNIVIPFYAYSTMERAVKNGEIITAKTRARLLSAIPQAYFGNRIIFIDLHAEGIPHYLEGGTRAVHIYAKSIIIQTAINIAGKDFVMASTDAGRAKWVESLANEMQVEAAFVYKRRLSGSDTKLTGVNADVKNKKVIIYDDMIRTGGSLLQAAKAYKEAGAAQIYVLATHGVLPEGAVSKLKTSGLIEKIVVTNTHPSALAQQDDFLEVVSVGDLIAEKLLAIRSL